MTDKHPDTLRSPPIINWVRVGKMRAAARELVVRYPNCDNAQLLQTMFYQALRDDATCLEFREAQRNMYLLRG
jgi:hypothetical protein